MAQNGQKLFFGNFLDVCISKTVGPTTFVLLTKIDQKGRFTLQKNFFGPLGPKSWDLKIEAIASQQEKWLILGQMVDFRAFLLQCKSDQKGRFTLQKKFFGPIGPVVRPLRS